MRECEENLPIFDKMSTEAGYLMEQPNMARELDSIQKRWGSIISSSEDRSHKVEKMFGAWTAYTNELENFQENLDRLQNRLASDPNVGTTDVQVLEHELALAKVRGSAVALLKWSERWVNQCDFVATYGLKDRLISMSLFPCSCMI